MKDEDVFASTTTAASVRMLLSLKQQTSETKGTQCSDVKTAFLNAHMKDGDVVSAKPPHEWQPETLDPSKGSMIWTLHKKSLWPEERTETLAGPSGADPHEVRLRPEHA